MDPVSLDRALDLLAAQHGVAHVAQLRRLGLPEDRVAQRVRSGSWSSHPGGVVAVAGAPDSGWRALWLAVVQVAVREDGRLRPAAVGGLGAAWLHGVVPEPPTTAELVCGRGTWRPAGPGVRVREVRDWADRSFVRIGGLLVTALPDTLVDVAPYFGDADYLGLLQEQAFARADLPGRVLERCHRGSRGSARSRRAVVTLLGGVDSVLHARGVAALRAAGLAPDRCGGEAVAGAGPSDCVYLRNGRPVLAVEFDGDVHRRARRTFLHDRAKDLALLGAGCVTLRFTREQVERPALLAGAVRSALARSAAASATDSVAAHG